MTIDSYLTVAAPVTGEFKDRGSKFIAYALPFDQETLLEKMLEDVKTAHPKARHHCYAYKIGTDLNRFRINDDGEPSGTAGKPILGQIQSFQLSNVLIIIVRYFGGTKLGVSGLIHAYKSAAKEALSKAVIIRQFICSEYIFRFGYENMGQIMSVLKDNDIDIIDKSFDTNCYLRIRVRITEEYDKLIKIKAAMLMKSTEEISESTVIPFCSIEKS